MSKDIHTPRGELICGAIDRAEDIARDHSLVYLLDELARIRNHAERMEAKLVSRKQEADHQELYVQALKSELATLKAGQGEAVAIIEYTGYEPANSLKWLTKGLAYMEPGTKLYTHSPVVAAAVEAVEVVAWVTTGFSRGTRTRRAFTVEKADADQQHENWLPHYHRVTTDDLMTVAQHQRIVAVITAPPASADTVSVPREMAARLCSTDNHVRQTARRELRSMLAAQGVKP